MRYLLRIRKPNPTSQYELQVNPLKNRRVSRLKKIHASKHPFFLKSVLLNQAVRHLGKNNLEDFNVNRISRDMIQT